MLKVTAEDIARALGYNYSGLNDKIITSVTCDSREVTEGSLFIALAGEKTRQDITISLKPMKTAPWRRL